MKNSIVSIPKLVIITLSILLTACSKANTENAEIFYSEYVGDRFEIYVNLPQNYDPEKEHSIVYYMDANLKLGQTLRRQITLPENEEKLGNVIFVGVGHIGSYRKRRRRDFIPPKFTEGNYEPGSDAYFGQAHHFYQFMINELMHSISQIYKTNGQHSLIGHSFSGLFAYYCLFQEDNPFKSLIALSPSLWANYDNFFEVEEAFSQSGQTPKAYLFHACGSQELANKVRSTSRKMNDKLQQRNYEDFTYDYKEFEGKGHNSMVPMALEHVLKQVDF